jgi:hypothetical protein
MKLYSSDGSELMEVSAIERDGEQLVIKGRIFQSMPLSARLKPAEVRKGLKLLNFKTAWFVLSMLFRR